MDAPRPRRLVHQHSFAYLLVIPVLLAISTAVLLFVHSDLNMAMLYSQCYSRSRLEHLSRLPVVGAPSCFIVSFFHEALDSVRSLASLSVVLSFIAGLLTVSTVESARICNWPNVLIAYPTGAWLVFNLIGGALVWELVIIPSFFHRSQELLRMREAARDAHRQENVEVEVDSHDPNLGADRRHLKVVAEVFAIPISVAVGFVAPSIAMLVTNSPVAIGVWLFFPVYVSLIRQGIRWAITFWLESKRRSFHLESHSPSLTLMYAVPVVCSIVAHVFSIWSFTRRDDRRNMTRSAVTFIEIDFFFIFLTVLYWVLVEAGWRVALVMTAVSVVLGPGAGVSLGWIYREQHVGEPSLQEFGGLIGDDEEHAGGEGPDEETPLLASD